MSAAEVVVETPTAPETTAPDTIAGEAAKAAETAETTETVEAKEPSTIENPSTIAGDAAKEAEESSGDQEVSADAAEDGEGDGKGEESGDPEEGTTGEYTDFALPDGFELDGDRLEATIETFKDLNLTQEQGQKLVDFYTSQEAKRIEQTELQQVETIEGWRTELEKDPFLGGEKLQTTKSAVGKALRAFDVAIEGQDGKPGETLTGFLNRTGLGNHKTVVGFLTAVGHAIEEDSGGSGGEGPEDGLTPAQRFYPTMRPE